MIWTSCASDPFVADAASDHLLRASIRLRSRPPAPEEVERVRGDPGAVAALVQAWSQDDEAIGALVRDIHAESLLVRFDTQNKMPPVGPLAEYSAGQVAASLDEAPLKLIEQVVISDRPYTEIVTTNMVMADAVVSAAYGPAHDPEGPTWQESVWPDGRPAAGILSSTTLWQRHPTGNFNFHRSRATVVANALLCDDVTTRTAAGAIDPRFQEEAVRTDPDCVACHAILDPLASTFWGLAPYTLPGQVAQAHEADCAGSHADYCYPLAYWRPELEAEREVHGLPPAALYGEPVASLSDLGETIARDPRFASCTVRRFWSYLARIPQRDVPADLERQLTRRFVDGGYDARQLLADIVAHPRFAPTSAAAPAAHVRPQQMVRTIEAITGYRWRALPGAGWGSVELGTTDRYGYQTLMGGIDGWRIVGPEPGALPTRELALAWLAEEAASFAAERELHSAGRRDLFVEGAPTEERSVRRQLAYWHLRILGEVVEEGSEAVDRDVALLDTLSRSRSPEEAWTLMLAAFLQHPRWVVL